MTSLTSAVDVKVMRLGELFVIWGAAKGRAGKMRDHPDTSSLTPRFNCLNYLKLNMN